MNTSHSFRAAIHLKEFGVARNRRIWKNIAAFAIALLPVSFVLIVHGQYDDDTDLLTWLILLWVLPDILTKRINARVKLDEKGVEIKAPVFFFRKPRQIIRIPWDKMEVCVLQKQKGDIAAYTLYIEVNSRPYTIKFLQLSLAYLFVNKGKLLTVLKNYAPEAEIQIT